MELVKWIAAEWAVISVAPVLSFGLVLLGGFGGYWLAKAIAKGKADAQAERIEGLKDDKTRLTAAVDDFKKLVAAPAPTQAARQNLANSAQAVWEAANNLSNSATIGLVDTPMVRGKVLVGKTGDKTLLMSAADLRRALKDQKAKKD